MKLLILCVCLIGAVVCEEAEREKRSAGGYGGHQTSYHRVEKHYYKPKTTKCYQCSYSPPKTYYDKKVFVESHHYGHEYDDKHDGYGQSGYGDKNGWRGGHYGGYTKKTVVPVPFKVRGGWDKCLGPFDYHQANAYGVDVWDCHGNCYTRKDKNGNVFRGCYKGEYGVNQHKLGCNYQAGSLYCFCKGDKCNNGPAPH